MGQQRYPIYGPEHDACGIGAVVSIQGIKTYAPWYNHRFSRRLRYTYSREEQSAALPHPHAGAEQKGPPCQNSHS